MRINRLALLSGAILMLSAAAPAMAQSISAKNPEAMRSALAAAGHAVELKKDSDGDPLLSVEIKGLRFSIAFFGCENHVGCTTVALYKAFRSDKKLTADQMNRFNGSTRFARAYLDMLLVEGISSNAFVAHAEIFRATVGAFLEQVK
jgi:hypothetical protein